MSNKRISYKAQFESIKKELDEFKNLSTSNPLPSENIINKNSSRLYRIEQDLQKWRSALSIAESVENPAYYELQRIYNDVELNAVVSNVKDIRKNYILSRDYKFIDADGNEDDKVNEFFSKKWFKSFVSEVIDAVFYGYSLIQLGDIIEDQLTGIKTVDRQNVNPKFKTILSNPYNNSNNTSFEDSNIKDWYVFVNNDGDLHYEGLFSKIAPYYMIYQVAMLAFNDYAIRFGSPQAVVKTPKTNEKDIKNIENYLSNLMNGSYGIFHINDEILFVEASGKSGEVYSTLMNTMKDNIASIVLGSPLSQEQAFVGSANIRQNIANIYSLNDIQMVEYYVNEELVPRLVRLGLNFLDGYKIDFDKTNKIDPELEFQRVLQLIQSGQFTVPAEWINEKFGIPVQPISVPIFKNTDNPDVQTE